MSRSRFYLFILTAALLTGCKVGPNYSRPDLAEPSVFRFGGKKSTRSLGDLEWRSVFQDSALRALIDEALANNLDLQAASARVLQAQANLAAVRSQFLPTIGAGYNYNRSDLTNFTNATQNHSIGITLLDYEADFWGKIRRSSEAARAQVLATEDGRRMVQVGLIAGIATAYVTLCEQDHELGIARRTLAARTTSLGLITQRQKGGQSPLTDVRQAEVLIAEANAAMRTIEKQIAKLEHQISYLAGRPPGAIRRTRSFDSIQIVSTVPAGLPSDLLQRRPDLRAAEQLLIAATANIGVAQARLLPSFTLTASAGLRSREFSGLFDNPTRIWQLGPAVNVPIFTGGRLMAAIRGSKAARDEAEANYRKTVLQSLREVSDALISRQKSAGVRAAQSQVVQARQSALGLIRERYDNGASAYLEVLYNDQELFAAELSQARARLDEIAATIELYRSLGGGWDKSSIPAAK
jgi:multidrug efflux system outer membrane protein|uniref:efflux transporter outer membrane subunit n=1 Tax=Prosthecobacter sp. TaxID=1965333 RepID=UPI0037851BA8